MTRYDHVTTPSLYRLRDILWRQYLAAESVGDHFKSTRALIRRADVLVTLLRRTRPNGT